MGIEKTEWLILNFVPNTKVLGTQYLDFLPKISKKSNGHDRRNL